MSRFQLREIAISLHIEALDAADLTAGQGPGKPNAAGPETQRPAGRWVALIWVVPGLLTLGLGVWRLSGPALWADELATWGAVRLSWSQLWQLTESVDAVLAPYYAMMKVYTGFAGTGTFALRLPALLAMPLTTLVVVALGRRLGGNRAGLFAGLMFAVLPVVSRYAQEARPYAISMLFGSLAVLLLLRLIDRPGVASAAGYGLAVVAAGLVHPLSALLMLAAHAIAMVWRQAVTRPREWHAVAWWSTSAVAGAVPAVVLSWQGNAQRTQISWITLVNVDVLQSMPQSVFISPVVGGMVLVLAALAVRGGGAASVLGAAGFVPPVLLLSAGMLVPVWTGRYVLVAVPALVALAGAVLARAGRASGAAALALLTLLGYPVHLEVRSDAGHSQDSQKIADVIGSRYMAGDVALFPDTHPSIAWSPRDIYERYLPAPKPPDVLRVSAQRTDGRFLAEECPAASCLGAPPRIWVIRVDDASDPYKDMAPAKRDKLKNQYRVVQTWQYQLLGIALLQRIQPNRNTD